MLNEGFWRLSPRSYAVEACTWRVNNQTHESVCAGGAAAGVDGTGYCREGHTGPKCETCTVAGTYWREEDGSCAACPTTLSRLVPWLIVAALLLLGLLVVAMAGRMVSNLQRKKLSALFAIGGESHAKLCETPHPVATTHRYARKPPDPYRPS